MKRVHLRIKATGMNLTQTPFLSKEDALDFCARYKVDLSTLTLIYL